MEMKLCEWDITPHPSGEPQRPPVIRGWVEGDTWRAGLEPRDQTDTSSDGALSTHTLDTGGKGVTGLPDEVLGPKLRKHEQNTSPTQQRWIGIRSLV